MTIGETNDLLDDLRHSIFHAMLFVRKLNPRAVVVHVNLNALEREDLDQISVQGAVNDGDFEKYDLPEIKFTREIFFRYIQLYVWKTLVRITQLKGTSPEDDVAFAKFLRQFGESILDQKAHPPPDAGNDSPARGIFRDIINGVQGDFGGNIFVMHRNQDGTFSTRTGSVPTQQTPVPPQSEPSEQQPRFEEITEETPVHAEALPTSHSFSSPVRKESHSEDESDFATPPKSPVHVRAPASAESNIHANRPASPNESETSTQYDSLSTDDGHDNSAQKLIAHVKEIELKYEGKPDPSDTSVEHHSQRWPTQLRLF